jgi:hypothetical protein
MAPPGVAARPLEEAYQLADLHGIKRSSMSANANGLAGSRSPNQRLPGEEFGDDGVDAFIAENQGFQHMPQGE